MCATTIIAEPGAPDQAPNQTGRRGQAMIELHNVSKSYPTVAGRKVVLDRLSLVLPWGAKVGCSGATAPASRRCSG